MVTGKVSNTLYLITIIIYQINGENSWHICHDFQIFFVVTLFKVDEDYEKANPREWGFHTARVNCLAWSPDSNFVASGGLDCNIIIWSVQQPEKHIIIKVAHTQSQITGIKWLDAKTIASCGQDGNVKVWDIDWQN